MKIMVDKKFHQILHEKAMQDQNKIDYIIDSKEIFINDDLTGRFKLFDKFHYFTTNQTSIKSLARNLSIPYSYLKTLVDAELKELLAYNLNILSSHYSKQIMLRAFIRENSKLEARAFLSNRFARIDDYHLIQATFKALNQLNASVHVKTVLNSMEQFKLSMILDDIFFEDKETAYHAGFTIENSEIGLSSVRISAYIFRQVCSNGLIIKYNEVFYERRHLGSKLDEGRLDSAYKTEFELKEIENFILYYYDHFETFIDAFMTTKEVIIEEPLTVVSNLVSHHPSFTVEDAKDVLTLNVNKYDNTLFGLINSITEVAQNRETSRQFQLEEFAGNFLYKSIEPYLKKADEKILEAISN